MYNKLQQYTVEKQMKRNIKQTNSSEGRQFPAREGFQRKEKIDGTLENKWAF